MSGQSTILSHRPVHTPSPSVSGSSLHSQDGRPQTSTPPIPEEHISHENHSATTFHSKKPSMTSRISRMFSTAKIPTENGAREPQRDRNTDSGTSDTESQGGQRPWPPETPSRQQSYSEKRPESAASSERRTSIVGKKEVRDPEPMRRRFEVGPDGTHEHMLKSAKRQEKLSDLLRDMLGGKKVHHPA